MSDALKPIDLIIREFLSRLAQAVGIEGVGDALAAAGRELGFPDLLIVQDIHATPVVIYRTPAMPDVTADPILTTFARLRLAGMTEPATFGEACRALHVDPQTQSRMPHTLEGKELLNITLPDLPEGARQLIFCGARNGGEVDGLSRSVLYVVARMSCERRDLGKMQHPPRHDLTARETEAMHHLAAGKTDAEVAQALGVSMRTVRFHIDNTKRKLGAATRAQALVKFLRGPDTHSQY